MAKIITRVGKRFKVFLAAATFVLLIGPVSAQANLIFDWTGTCLTGCVGQATFHAVTTDAYVPGTVGLRPDLLEARYTDNRFTRDFMPLWLGNGFGFNFPVAGSQGDISEETAQLWIRPAVS
jgi:hypothetical protein